MKQNNFVAPMPTNIEPNTAYPIVSTPEIMPINPGAMFDGRDIRQPNVDPFRRGLEFNIKYAPLAIVILIFAVGLGLRNNWDFGTSAIVFASISILGYWLLGFTENVFDPYSGHVIKAFFGWLVLRHQIGSNERVTLAYYQVERKRLDLQAEDRRIAQGQRCEVESRLIAPQAEFNALATHRHPPVSTDAIQSVAQIPVGELTPPTWRKAPVETNNGSDAAKTLLDFVEDLYEQEQYTSSGRLTVSAPWTKRGVDREGNSVGQTVKKQIEDMLAQIQPPLFRLVVDQKAWFVNIENYPDVTDAYNVIDEVVIRKQ